ncbi:MAG: hypothetical protein ACE5JJ_11130 [Nitrospinota bacterium]
MAGPSPQDRLVAALDVPDLAGAERLLEGLAGAADPEAARFVEAIRRGLELRPR